MKDLTERRTLHFTLFGFSVNQGLSDETIYETHRESCSSRHFDTAIPDGCEAHYA
jgi:hypothetical protein